MISDELCALLVQENLLFYVPQLVQAVRYDTVDSVLFVRSLAVIFVFFCQIRRCHYHRHHHHHHLYLMTKPM